MGALKEIKLLFTVDVKDLENKIKAAQFVVNETSKKIEDANTQLIASQEKVAEASNRVADAMGGQSTASKILSGALKVVTGALGALSWATSIALSAFKLLDVSVLGAALTFIKIVPQLQMFGAEIANIGRGVEWLTIKFALGLSKGLELTAKGLLLLGPRLIGFQQVVNSTSITVTKLGQAIIASGFTLARWLIVVGGVPPAMESAIQSAVKISAHFAGMSVAAAKASPTIQRMFSEMGTGLKLTGAAAATTLPAFQKQVSGISTVFGKLVQDAKKSETALAGLTRILFAVGASTLKFLDKLISLSNLIPFIGGLVIWFGAQALFSLGKWFVSAALNALEFSKTVAKTASDLADASTRMGIGVEKLQQYQFAAKQSGIETKALNSGLERFQRKVAEAHQGTGTFGKELERLGVAIVDNKGFVRDGTAVFEDYMSAIGRTQNSQEQLRLSFVAFGREGATLVNLAKEGEAGFAGLRDESERLGVVLSATLLRGYKAINDQLDANNARLDALRTRNSLFLAQIALKWDNLKTSINAAKLELLDVFNSLETRSVSNLTSKLKETEAAIERTKNALNSSIANLPLVTGVLQVFLGGLIEDQERILEAIKIAKGEELQVKAERPEDVTAQINEQIAARELELSQQVRLLEAAKMGEEQRLRVAAAIQAENDARALGIQATVDEQERIKQTSLALAETQAALEQVTAANQNFADGEEIRLAALEKLGTASARTDQALLSNVNSLLILGNASVKTQMEFHNLSAKLVESAVALDKLEKELAKGAGAGEDAKKKFGELSREAEKLRNAVDRSRSGLEKMEQNLRTQSGLADITGNAFIAMGQDFASSAQGVDTLNESLMRNRDALEGVGDAADSVGNSMAGAARQTRSLGAVVGGDATDPANIQRALNNLNAQLRAVQSTFGDAGLGFKEIQTRAIQTEIARLEADMRFANEETRKGIIQAVINANSELSGEALDKAITERLALERRYGLLPSSGSSRAGFTAMRTS